MAKPKLVYVVFGQTGEYSDRTEWPVMAYYDEASAKAHVKRAGIAANELFVRYEKVGYPRTDNYENPHDPDMKLDYTGTTYYYLVVPLAKKETA
jgi:hypothetical protein